MKRTTKGLIVAIALLIVAGIAWVRISDGHGRHHKMQRFSDGAEIMIPEFTEDAKLGEAAFIENCAVCHGEHASGTDQGPPLIHIIYEPSHHNDASFYRAVAQGVRGHHWRFGNMPALEGVGEADVEKIIAYVRETQRANGIN